ncbi:MAG TPA: alkaline phosphatase family protein, partial [Candidatus Binatia bacterium]|nr:alkaline phosphatase family protein [Candidatus Binatia bacterium]
MRNCFRKIAFLACAIFAAAIPGATHGQTAKAIVLAWDGTVPTFVDELTRQGKLPNLAKLIAGGTFADDVRPGFPSKTAPGFASLMTGAPPRVTGISGNRVPREPRAEYTILDSMAGFSAAPLLAEPIWAAARRAGKKVVISHIPSFAAENSEGTVRLYGYDTITGRDGIVTPRLSKPQPAASWDKLPASDAPALEISFAVAASKFFGLLVDDPADEQIGYDTLLLTRSRNAEDIEVKIKSAAAGATGELFWSGPVEVKTTGERSASVYFRLFELRGDGSDFFLYFTRPAR